MVKDESQVSDEDYRVSAKPAQEIQNEPCVWINEEFVKFEIYCT